MLFWSVLLAAAVPGLAAEQTPASEPLLASAAAWDHPRLNTLFDASQAKGGVRVPEPAAAAAPSAPAPERGPDPREISIQVGPEQPLQTPRSLAVPNPPVTAAYRRAFRALLARPDRTDRYDELILKHARNAKLDPRLLKAIIAAESEFVFSALSPKGARGLMQVMPRTAEQMGVDRGALMDPESNIQAGAAYVARLFKTAWRRYKLKGVRYQDAPAWLLQRVIAAYHAGPRFLVRRTGWFPSTLHYVKKVTLFYRSRVTEFRRSPAALDASPSVMFSGAPLG